MILCFVVVEVVSLKANYVDRETYKSRPSPDLKARSVALNCMHDCHYHTAGMTLLERQQIVGGERKLGDPVTQRWFVGPMQRKCDVRSFTPRRGYMHVNTAPLRTQCQRAIHSHFWLAIIFIYTVRLQQFWHKCCRESRQSNYTLFYHLTWLMLLHYLGKQETRKLRLFT